MSSLAHLIRICHVKNSAICAKNNVNTCTRKQRALRTMIGLLKQRLMALPPSHKQKLFGGKWLSEYLRQTNIPAIFHSYNTTKRAHAIVWFAVWTLFTLLCAYNLYTIVVQIQDNYSSVDVSKVLAISITSSRHVLFANHKQYEQHHAAVHCMLLRTTKTV